MLPFPKSASRRPATGREYGDRQQPAVADLQFAYDVSRYYWKRAARMAWWKGAGFGLFVGVFGMLLRFIVSG